MRCLLRRAYLHLPDLEEAKLGRLWGPTGAVAMRRPKFPELESLVHHPMDYARVVQKIGNEMDMTLIDLEDILPQVCAALTCTWLHRLCLQLSHPLADTASLATGMWLPVE